VEGSTPNKPAFAFFAGRDTIRRMRARDLLNKLHDEPFQPFRVRLSTNSTIDVLDPNTVVVGPSSAMMPIETMRDGRSGYYIVSRWRTVALAHMAEFLDIDPPKSRTTRANARLDHPLLPDRDVSLRPAPSASPER
jgi:hypothetical protein